MSGRYGRERLGVRGRVLRAGLFLTALGATACEIPPTPGGQPTPTDTVPVDLGTATDIVPKPTDSSTAIPTETATPTVEPWTPTSTPTSTEYPTETPTSTQEPTATEVDRMAEIAVEADAFFKGEGKYTDEAMHEWLQQDITGERELGLLAKSIIASYDQGMLLGYIDEGDAYHLYLGTKDGGGRRVGIVTAVYKDMFEPLFRAGFRTFCPTISNAIPQNISGGDAFTPKSSAEFEEVMNGRIGKAITVFIWTDLFEKLPADQASVLEQIKQAMGVQNYQLWHDRIEARRQISSQLNEYLFETDLLKDPNVGGYDGVVFTNAGQLSGFSIVDYPEGKIPMVDTIIFRVK